MSLGTQALHPQASLTKATLPDSLPPCHIGSLLWITWLSPTCHRMVSLLPFSATWYPPDALPTSLSHPKTEDLGVEVETQQRWDVRYSLQGWITRIRDHTNYMVSVTTGCQFELRQKSAVTDCHSEASVSRPSVPTPSWSNRLEPVPVTKHPERQFPVVSISWNPGVPTVIGSHFLSQTLWQQGPWCDRTSHRCQGAGAQSLVY